MKQSLNSVVLSSLSDEAMGQPIRAPVAATGCAEKQQLVDQIKRAVGEIVFIHAQEVDALLRGDLTTDETFQDRLQTARELKALLVERLRNHLAVHRC